MDTATKTDRDIDDVDILLAVKNGAQYLQEQIDSIFRQNGDFKARIICNLDSSNDESAHILNRNGIIYSEVDNLGPCSNFLALIHASTARYAALCDQDDIWYSDKLSRGVSFLQSISGPGLYVGSIDISTGGKRIASEKNFVSSLLRNDVQGNSIIMNAAMVRLIQESSSVHAIMHDWWIHIIGCLEATVLYDKRPTISYRIHNGNTIGIKKFRIKLKDYLFSIIHPGTDHRVFHQALGLQEIFLHYDPMELSANQHILLNLNVKIRSNF